MTSVPTTQIVRSEGPKTAGEEFYRYELKIPLDRAQHEEFVPSLSQLGVFPRKAFPDRRVNSVYFDLPTFDNYADNVAGIGRRQKTRIRWYYNDLANVNLEVKRKENKLSAKRVFRLRNAGGNTIATRVDLKALIAANSDGLSVHSLAGMLPVLEVSYDRKYFSLGEGVRMTVDRGQTFRRLYPFASAFAVRSPVEVVVEFKFPRAKAREVKSILAGLPFRVFRHSKYVIGIDAAYG